MFGSSAALLPVDERIALTPTKSPKTSRYFFIHNLSRDEPEIIRYAALLRGTESAWQALAYGLSSLTVFGEVGGVYMNFGLWGISIYPAWLVLRHFGNTKSTGIEVVDGPVEGQTAKAEGGVMATDRSGLINT